MDFLSHPEEPGALVSTKENAARGLANLAETPKNLRTIINAGALKPLIAIVNTGSQEGQEHAARALVKLCIDIDHLKTLTELGGVPAFVALLVSGNDQAKEHAAGALSNLAANDYNRMMIRESGVRRNEEEGKREGRIESVRRLNRG